MTADQGLVRRLENAQEGYVPLPTGSAGAAVIDVERSREVVRKLRAIVEDVAATHQILVSSAVVAPAADPVSRNAAAAAMVMIGASRRYLSGWYEALLQATTALERQIDAYAIADERISGVE